MGDNEDDDDDDLCEFSFYRWIPSLRNLGKNETGSKRIFPLKAYFLGLNV